MKLLQLVNRDGSSTFASTEPLPDNFDTQAWAEQRRPSLRLLQIVEVREIFLERQES